MPTYKIITLGCKVNQCESDAILAELQGKGWQTAGKNTRADACIVNTCAVTGKAAMQSRQAIRKLIRENPGAQIIVTGCAAQVEKKTFQGIDGITHIVRHSEKHTIGDILTEPPAGNGSPVPSSSGFPMAFTGKRTRPFLKIQDGCNAFCNYCIVPYARGRSRSMPVDQVITAVQRLAGEGYHEIVLTGIHLGVYGLDFSPSSSLLGVLHRILSHTTIPRIRLSSIEPGELSDELIDLVANSPRLCDHFHIPLQSGDDHILREMGRPYDTDLFKDRIRKIEETLPEACIGTDILVGFPGEADAHFENALTLIDNLPISYLHVFPFSPRKGTKAYLMDGRVADKDIKYRCAQFRRLGQEKRQTFAKEAIGTVQDVLVETRRDRKTGLLIGFSSTYQHICIEGSDHLKNHIVPVRVKRIIENEKLLGTMIDGA